MTDFTAVPVVSGVPYRVIHVSDRPPAGLSDFVGRHSVSISTNKGEVLWVLGQGAVDGNGVRFYEKSNGGGKDVRVWRISRSEDGISYLAEQVSSY